MKTLYFDRLTRMGTPKMSHCDIEIEVPESFSMTKGMDEFDHMAQKTNEHGLLVYLANEYEVKEYDEVTGQEITSDVTDNPHIEIIHKVNQYGKPLYYDLDSDGELIETTKPINSEGEANDPVILEVHVEDEQGNLLYVRDIIETKTSVTLMGKTEVAESKTYYDWKEEYEDNEPVMIEKYKTIIVSVFDKPELFGLEEVVSEIYSLRVSRTSYANMFGDMFINEEDIDFEFEGHNANTGLCILSLNPNGKARTKEISLPSKSSRFEMVEKDIPDCVSVLLNGVEFVDGVAVLDEPTDKCVLTFINNKASNVDVKSYCVAY